MVSLNPDSGSNPAAPSTAGRPTDSRNSGRTLSTSHDSTGFTPGSSDDDLSFTESDEPDLDNSELDEPRATNAYAGPSSTFKSWNATEMAVMDSIETEQARNLSLHVYLASFLRLRLLRAGVRSAPASRSSSRHGSVEPGRHSRGSSVDSSGPESSRTPAGSHSQSALSRGVRLGLSQPKGMDLQYRDWLPPRSWTAWPLPPSIVPRSDEMFPSKAEGERSGLRTRFDLLPPADDLVENVIAVLERRARRQWRERHRRTRPVLDPGKGRASAGDGPSGEAAGGGDDSDDDETSSSGDTDGETTSNDSADLSDPDALLTADPDVISKLLRPHAQSIVSDLDSLMHSLADSRLPVGCYASSSSDDDDDDDESTSSGRDDTEEESDTDETPGETPQRSGSATVSESGEAERGSDSGSDRQSDIDSDSEQSGAIQTRGENARASTKVHSNARPRGRQTSLSRATSPTRSRRTRPANRSRTSSQISIRSNTSASSGSTAASQNWRANGGVPYDWKVVLQQASLMGLPRAALERASARLARLFDEPPPDLDFNSQSLKRGGNGEGKVTSWLGHRHANTAGPDDFFTPIERVRGRIKDVVDDWEHYGDDDDDNDDDNDDRGTKDGNRRGAGPRGKKRKRLDGVDGGGPSSKSRSASRLSVSATRKNNVVDESATGS